MIRTANDMGGGDDVTLRGEDESGAQILDLFMCRRAWSHELLEELMEWRIRGKWVGSDSVPRGCPGAGAANIDDRIPHFLDQWREIGDIDQRGLGRGIVMQDSADWRCMNYRAGTQAKTKNAGGQSCQPPAGKCFLNSGMVGLHHENSLVR